MAEQYHELDKRTAVIEAKFEIIMEQLSDIKQSVNRLERWIMPTMFAGLIAITAIIAAVKLF